MTTLGDAKPGRPVVLVRDDGTTEVIVPSAERAAGLVTILTLRTGVIETIPARVEVYDYPSIDPPSGEVERAARIGRALGRVIGIAIVLTALVTVAAVMAALLTWVAHVFAGLGVFR